MYFPCLFSFASTIWKPTHSLGDCGWLILFLCSFQKWNKNNLKTLLIYSNRWQLLKSFLFNTFYFRYWDVFVFYFCFQISFHQWMTAELQMAHCCFGIFRYFCLCRPENLMFVCIIKKNNFCSKISLSIFLKKKNEAATRRGNQWIGKKLMHAKRRCQLYFSIYFHMIDNSWETSSYFFCII